MRFDDRLLTVLNQPAEDRHDTAVRWRQLVDLVARAGSSSASPIVTEALEAIRSEAQRVEEPLRAAAARAVAALPLPLRLLEYFAADSLTVSAPVLAAATLDAHQWQVLRSAADDETRRFIDTLHPELAAGAQAAAERPLPPSEPASPQQEPEFPVPPSLHEVVERIERRRRLRSGLSGSGESPSLAESPALFRWECGPGGEIAWVEGAPRGPLIGRSIAKPQESEGDLLDQEVVRAFAMRAPFRDAALTLTGGGPVSGEWKLSGVPAFEPADGRFAGYRGVALREVPAKPAAPELEKVPELLSDPASLRELVHEIKTPLNAIIGFAEIIDGQYLGPAQSGYRERAAEIVAQARILLAAIDDLDFAARLRGRGSDESATSDFSAFFPAFAERVQQQASERGVTLAIDAPPSEGLCTLDRELAERLLDRFAEAVFAATTAGETLRLAVRRENGFCALRLSRPRALEGMSEAQLFDGQHDERADFSLRMVVGLAQIVGGKLVADGSDLVLRMPMAA